MKYILVFFILCLTVVSLLLVSKCDNDKYYCKMTYEQFEEYLQANKEDNNGQLNLSYDQIDVLIQRVDWQTVPDTVIEEMQKPLYIEFPQRIDLE